MTTTRRYLVPLRVLAALLSYPNATLRLALPHLMRVLECDRALSAGRRAEVLALIQQLRWMDDYEAEARYVDTFDRGRSTSLHLFEHVHGDSRERGPALVDLGQYYEQAGLRLTSTELPDHLTVALEFASTQPDALVREFLGEMAPAMHKIFSALSARTSPYATVLAAVLEIAGERVQAVPVSAEPPLDESWIEPPAFDGCSTAGQAPPGAPQPIHIVRKTGSKQGVHA